MFSEREMKLRYQWKIYVTRSLELPLNATSGATTKTVKDIQSLMTV